MKKEQFKFIYRIINKTQKVILLNVPLRNPFYGMTNLTKSLEKK